MSGDTPVIPPSTCEEPIYQLTPGATVPAGTPEPYCILTPTPSGPYPVAVESTASTGTVTTLPGTGTTDGGGSGDSAVMVLGLVVIVVILGWYSLRGWLDDGDREDER